MDTTVVTQTAIGALAALVGGLGGAFIATRYQRLHEQRQQRERAAEVLGSVGPLLTELAPDSMLMWIPPVEPGQQDPIIGFFDDVAERSRIVRERLSTLAGWWPTPRGVALVQQLEQAIRDTMYWDAWAVRDLRRDRDFRHARDEAVEAWQTARSLANQLRAEIRGETPPPPSKVLLPAHPESWTGPAPTGSLERWFSR